MPVPEYILKMRAHIGHDLLMIVGAAAIIRNDAGDILLHRRADNRMWGIPAGISEPGEELAVCIIREVREETGLDVIPERIIGVYGGPSHVLSYPNGDQVASTSVCFECRMVGGSLRTDGDETLALRWFAPDNLPDSLMPHHRERIEHAVTRTEPFFRLPDSL